MLMTTTPHIEGKTIETYHGLVVGEAVYGANIVRDVFAGIRDIVGGRSEAYEKTFVEARDAALGEMTKRAKSMGANAIIGIQIGYEAIGANGSIMLASASGTAVTLR
jgi:uncharacterized protein YbjQ (UPF0145 family)